MKTFEFIYHYVEVIKTPAGLYFRAYLKTPNGLVFDQDGYTTEHTYEKLLTRNKG